MSSLILGSLEVNDSDPVVADLGSLNVFTTEVDAYKSRDFDKMLDLLLLSGVGPERPTKADMEQIVNVCLSMCAVDFSEIYSPARFKDRALRLGLSPGLAADLITGWELRSRTQRHACAKKLAEEKPHFLIASPPCTAFSALQRISRLRRDPEKVMDQMKEAEAHLDYSVGECERQRVRGGYFLFEQPASATSWHHKSVEELTSKRDVVRVVGPMCRWGMQATDRRTGRSGFVRKETAWMTNHPGLAEVLEGWCSCVNEDGSVPYRHVHLMGGLAAPAATYPPALVKAILSVMREHLRDKEELSDLAALNAGPSPHEAVCDYSTRTVTSTTTCAAASWRPNEFEQLVARRWSGAEGWESGKACPAP